MTFLLAYTCAELGCGSPSEVSQRTGVLWEVAAESAGTTPAVLDSVAVFGTLDGYAIGFDRQTGNVRWKRLLARAPVFGTVERAADLALLQQYELWAVDPRDGRIAWHFGGPDGGAAVYGLSTSGDTAFTGSVMGWASAVNARTGLAFWSVDLGEAPFEPAVTTNLVIYGTRGFMGANRQGPLGAGHLIALRRSDGSEVWRVPLPDTSGLAGGSYSGGVVWQDRVVVGTAPGEVYAVRLSDGAILWKVPQTAAGYTHAPAVLAGVVVLMRMDNAVEGRDADTGSLLWVLSRSSLFANPIVAGSHVYIIEGPVTIADPAGTVAWEYGGLDHMGHGQSFIAGQVAEDGTIYTWGFERLTGRDGPYVFALRPPVSP